MKSDKTMTTESVVGVAHPRLVRLGCDMPRDSFGQTSMDYIRRAYGVPAKRGLRVRYDIFPGEPNGTITGARDGRLLIRLDGWPKRRRPLTFHPTWNIHYPPTNA
jgi:hypothetical protein